MAITQKYLQSILEYRQQEGKFYWKIQKRGTRVGKKAGSIDRKAGYEQIGIDGKLYRSHRLAWIYVYGELPALEIDHINGIRSDNRIANLRDVPTQVNGQNRRGPNKNNTSSRLLGAYLHKGKYIAMIMVNRKSIYLGRFNTAELAHAAYCQAKSQAYQCPQEGQ